MASGSDLNFTAEDARKAVGELVAIIEVNVACRSRHSHIHLKIFDVRFMFNYSSKTSLASISVRLSKLAQWVMEQLCQDTLI